MTFKIETENYETNIIAGCYADAEANFLEDHPQFELTDIKSITLIKL